MSKKILLLVLITSFLACKDSKVVKEPEAPEFPKFQGFSLFGDSLFAQVPPEATIANLELAISEYEADPSDADNIIWYGRRVAYTGDYLRAIDIFTEGVRKFPNDARMYRHRGHRYISIRQFDKAIADYDKAVELILGIENEIEPDGMPNARNIPVSTLHGNIYYHLGLAHYLKQNWAEALDAYTKCKASGENPDNLVSSSHWLYMINRRMGDMKAANKSIADINADMDIIENFGYHRLCLYYKGEISLEELSGGEGESLSGQDAVDYGIANWHFYNADIENAIRIHKEILNRSSWNSFGYIATEADMNALGDDVLMLN